MPDTELSAVPSPIPNEHTVTPTPTPGVWGALQSMDFMAIEVQMILSAVFIIYVGAHASLRRPPSAAPPVQKRKRKDGKDAADRKEEFAPGFEASDAIMFPLIAAAVLIGLYYLIKWLQDPEILNKILRWYMSTTGVFSTGLFLGNTLQVVLGFVYPDYWADGKGRIFKIDTRSRAHKPIITSPDGINAGSSPVVEGDPKKRTPFPGLASQLPVSARVSEYLYTIRHLVMEDWNLELGVWGGVKEDVPFKATTIIGCLLGIAVQGLYLYTSNTMLANVIGLAVCFMACQYISVTSFNIGSLVLVGLFIYDIVMVFYTPFMVGVATQLDVPIKLTYTTAKRSSILGLGDIVVPGIFICLALRFDLWKHYQRKITREETHLKTTTTEDIEGEGFDVGNRTQEVTTVETAYREVKVPFVDPRGQWGNTFWTTNWQSLVSGESVIPSIVDGTFSKSYFHATIFGYLLGMLATVSVLLVFRRGQPALLYLVPGVVGSAYLTGWWRGELKDMWKYTEDGSLDVEDVVVEVDANGNVIKKPKKIEEKDVNGTKEVRTDKKDDGANEEKSYELLHFSITIPKEDSFKED